MSRCIVTWFDNGVRKELIYEDTKIFAAKLNKLRKLKGLSISEFSKAINWNKDCILDWELAVSVPSLNTLIEISNYFSVSVDYFLNGSQYEYEQLSLFC